MTNSYDSARDTLLHIKRVNALLIDFAIHLLSIKTAKRSISCHDVDLFDMVMDEKKMAIELLRRAKVHDESKLHSPEKEVFDRETPLLAGLEYGSEEYAESLGRLGPALDHHYAENSHHPQHYDDGIDGMSLADIIEMAMDWKAASERHLTGDIYKSVEINAERFNLPEDLRRALINTYQYMGFEK